MAEYIKVKLKMENKMDKDLLQVQMVSLEWVNLKMDNLLKKPFKVKRYLQVKNQKNNKLSVKSSKIRPISQIKHKLQIFKRTKFQKFTKKQKIIEKKVNETVQSDHILFLKKIKVSLK